MKLQEIFDQLTAGEFSQLSIGGADAGVIDDTNYSKVLAHINLGLTALFKRFRLKEGRLTLQLQANQDTYKLQSAFAVTSSRSTEDVRYLLDTESDPFKDDITKVERVRGYLDPKEPCIVDLGLNDASDDRSVTTPTALVLRVPACIPRQNLAVTYRAAHPKLAASLGYLSACRIDVQLPDTHLEALLYFVAGRAYTPVGMSNEGQAANTYVQKYEMACQTLEGQGLQVDQGGTNSKLCRNGWV